MKIHVLPVKFSTTSLHSSSFLTRASLLASSFTSARKLTLQKFASIAESISI